MSSRVVTSNRRARRNYDITETIEAGLVLTGSEVKSLREGRANLADAYGHFERGEAWLENAYIAPYAFAREGGHDPRRSRKLLLHRREIDRLASKVAERGLALVPLSIYFKEGRAKVELGLGRGRRAYDKRQAIKRREQEREMERALRRRQKKP